MEAPPPLEGRTTSRVPRHLRRFHHLSKSRSHPTYARPPHSLVLAANEVDQPVELCPPHWRRPPKQPLKARLRALLLNDWRSLHHPSPPSGPSPGHRPRDRPSMPRIKDSDDYLTARAANPRTGLVSPSVGTPSPRGTPGSPGEALQLRKIDAGETSPNPARPGLRRANEGRRVSVRAASVRGKKGWLVPGSGQVASPRVTTAVVEAGEGGDADRFVVKMPSAREPQPYAFPGCSAKEIAAFEVYREKARRVSGEGYDPRVLRGGRVGHGGVGEGAVRPYEGDAAAVPSRAVTVLKRRARGRECDNGRMTGGGCVTGAELSAATFAPFSSPKTPARHPTGQTTSLDTLGPALHGKEELRTRERIQRKPVAQTDLRALPRISFAHPSVAALPRAPHPASAGVAPRSCPLGCLPSAADGVCIASSATTGTHIPLFDDPAQTTADESDALTFLLSNTLIALLISLVDLSTRIHIRLPPLSVPALMVLRSPSADAGAKADAVKSLLRTAGHALGLLTATLVVWTLGSAVVRVMAVVLWPLGVSVRAMRWFCGM